MTQKHCNKGTHLSNKATKKYQKEHLPNLFKMFSFLGKRETKIEIYFHKNCMADKNYTGLNTDANISVFHRNFIFIFFFLAVVVDFFFMLKTYKQNVNILSKGNCAR